MPSTVVERLARIANSPAIKVPCRVATTANLASLSTLLTIDGVTLAADDRVLVKDQSNSIANGIYVASTSDWTRASDANELRDLVNGSMVLVTNGSTWALTEFRLSATNPVTPGTTAQTWEEISSEQSGSAATSAAAAAASASAAASSESAAAASAASALVSENAAELAETNAETAEAAAEAAEAAAEAAAISTVENLTGTSTTAITIGTGSKGPFTTQADKNFAVGRHLLFTSNANPTTHRMSGIVTAYSGTSLTVDVETFAGSGSRSDWTIRVDGEQGPEGGGAPDDASYVTLATNTGLSSERVLTAGTGVSLTDAGAGSTITVALASMAEGTVKGRAAGAGTGAPSDLAASTIGAGKQTIYIPASAMRPKVANGAEFGSATGGGLEYRILKYDPTTEETVWFEFAAPKSWNESTITFQVYWSHGSTTTNFGVVWALQAAAMSNDDSLGATLGTEVTVVDTGGTNRDLYISPESSALTIGGTPAEGDLCFFSLKRKVGDASDTMAIDADLVGIKILYTTSANTDD